MIQKDMYYKKLIVHSKPEKAAVLKLDAYIKKYERNYGKISLQVSSKKQLKLVELIHKLKKAIEKEEVDKQQAFQILKESNEAIKETIFKLQDSMKIYKESMRSEIAKLDCLNTDRLLNINYVYV